MTSDLANRRFNVSISLLFQIRRIRERCYLNQRDVPLRGEQHHRQRAQARCGAAALMLRSAGAWPPEAHWSRHPAGAVQLTGPVFVV